jgi:hypothetical protein
MTSILGDGNPAPGADGSVEREYVSFHKGTMAQTDVQRVHPGALEELIARQTGIVPRDLRLQVRPLRGGLVSASVEQVTARYLDGRGRQRVTSFVVKKLDGDARREAAVYEGLAGTRLRGLAPALLAIDRSDADVHHLYLEAIRPLKRWPWRQVPLAAAVLRCLAELHGASAALRPHVPGWDYDAELQIAAADLVEVTGRSRGWLEATAGLRVNMRLLRRLGAQLPVVRRQLSAFIPLETTVIHGDVHPGNVILGRRAGGHGLVFLDWARARLGSPLEDVSSWLHSLGIWEPEARRRHDTLLGTYLAMRGLTVPPARDLRDAYWLAASLNSFAGALKYHIEVATRPRVDERSRGGALRAIHHHLRVMRRADACLWA